MNRLEDQGAASVRSLDPAPRGGHTPIALAVPPPPPSWTRRSEEVVRQAWLAPGTTRYAVAVAASALTILLNAGLSNLVADIRLVNLFPAVVLASFLGGMGPGVVATVVCATSAAYLWLPPTASFEVHAGGDRVALGGFVVIGVLMSWLIERLHQMRHRTAEEASRALERERRMRDDLRRADEKLHVALEAGRMGVWEWITKTGGVTWSPTLEAIHGLAPGAFAGTFDAYQQDIHADDKDRVLRTIRETLENKRDHHLEYRIVRPDGQTRWVAAHGKIAVDEAGRPVGMTGLCMDVTEQKQLEETREGVIAELQRNVKFNQIFAGVLGHDLRNPLTAVTVTARRALEGNENDQLVKPLSRILHSSERMGRMIDQLLDFTRLRVGTGIRLATRRIDLVPVLGQIVDELEAAHPSSSLRFDHSGDSEGTWDPDRLAQVFSNLIANALHYGVPERGVNVRFDGSRPENVHVEVHNMGSIPADLLPKVFEPLAGGERRRDHSQGLGLGLFISHEIVRAHEGSIEVQSDEASGTTFTVLLPRTPAVVSVSRT